MRTKDEFKQEAIIKATVKLVNEIGFVSSSVSKIAKEAGVSPATIYVYYQNKEDLLVSVYVNIKHTLSKVILKDFDENLPIRDIFRNLWMNSFKYNQKYPDYFKFAEQFASSPYSDLVNKEEVEKYFAPMMQTFNRGVEQKIIKDVHYEMLAAFIYYPVMNLSNPRICKNINMDQEMIELGFQLAWDAIKL